MPNQQIVSLPQRPKIPRKPKLLRSNPLRLSFLANGNEFGYLIDDEDILSGYRYPSQPNRRLKIDDEDDDTELSEYVQFRLFLARQLALKRYYEKWG
jgi:hypothetical protein